MADSPTAPAWRRKRTLIPVSAVVVAALLLGAYLRLSSNTSSAGQPVAQLQNAIQRLLGGIDSSGLPGGVAGTLRTDAQQAKAAADRADTCAAITALTSTGHDAARASSSVPAASVDPLMSVDALALDAEALARSLPGTASCGGSPIAELRLRAPRVAVSSQDTNQVTFHLDLPLPAFAGRSGGGNGYIEPLEPGAAGRGACGIGTPTLPSLGELIAVPTGATPQIHLLGAQSYAMPDVRVWPQQPPVWAPAPMAGHAPPEPPTQHFVNTPGACSGGTIPASPASLGSVGSRRGLTLVPASLFTGSYEPGSQVLHIVTSVDVQVTFPGSTGKFGYGLNSVNAAWEQPFTNQFNAGVLNWGTIAQLPQGAGSPPAAPCGEMMMVVTDNYLLPAALSFAKARTNAGIPSRVFITDAAGDPSQGIVGDAGQTPLALLSTIRKQVFGDEVGCPYRPSYLTIMGDTAHVPTWEFALNIDENYQYITGDMDTLPFPEDPIASDQAYAFLHQQSLMGNGPPIIRIGKGVGNNIVVPPTDLEPDIIVGRLPASTLDQANLEVDAITGYEANPPKNDNLYGRVTGAEFYEACYHLDAQCTDKDKNPAHPSTTDLYDFIANSENAGVTIQEGGKQWLRIANDGSEYLNEKYTPEKDINGKLLDPSITWTTTPQQDITNAINGGTTLIWHADHGGGDGSGWFEPNFPTWVIPSLNNGKLLPVVWASDCDSGKFDSTTLANLTGGNPIGAYIPSDGENWMETGHASAFVGSSRVSYTREDGMILNNMAQLLYPGSYDGYLVTAPVTGIGTLLQESVAKYALDVAVNQAQDTEVRARGTILEYNLLGDPSMAIFRDPPKQYGNPQVNGSVANGQVHVGANGIPSGTAITLYRGSVALGRAYFAGGGATIPLTDGNESLAGLIAVFSADDHVSTSVALAPGVTTPPPTVTAPPTATSTPAATSPPTATAGPPAPVVKTAMSRFINGQLNACSTVTVTGSNLTGAIYVTVDGIKYDVMSVTSTSLKFNLPCSAPKGPGQSLTVTTSVGGDTQTSNSLPVTVS